jgi:hypothetical protein
MNERIRELAIQAGLPTALDYHQKRLEKFSELIVRECALVADQHTYDGKEIAKLIEIHFGISATPTT